MTKAEFVSKALDGGWIDPNAWYTIEEKPRIVLSSNMSQILLDPKAWKAVGTIEGWDIKTSKQWWEKQSLRDKIVLLDEWENKMHNMVDALCTGKTVEEYFETI